MEKIQSNGKCLLNLWNTQNSLISSYPYSIEDLLRKEASLKSNVLATHGVSNVAYSYKSEGKPDLYKNLANLLMMLWISMRINNSDYGYVIK